MHIAKTGRLSGILGLALFAGACTATYAENPNPGGGGTGVSVTVPSATIIVGNDGYPQGTSASALGIPPGHLPPPGACRIWYPGRPPGQQPPPTSCAVGVPPGAVLVRG
jgi:hypothetical protein